MKLVEVIDTKKPSSIPQDLYLYQEIFDAILAQKLLPGTKLPEDELAKIFGVSRSIVRRTLLRFSQNRIVEIQPNRGAYVASPTIKQAREVLAARRMIEDAIVREAVVCATQNDLAKLRNKIREEQEVFDHVNHGSAIRLSGDFHLTLANASHNSTLVGFMKTLVPQTSLIIALYEIPRHTNCSLDEHLALLNVMAAGDVEQAASLMDKHLHHIEAKLNLEEKDDKQDLSSVFANVFIPS